MKLYYIHHTYTYQFVNNSVEYVKTSYKYLYNGEEPRVKVHTSPQFLMKIKNAHIYY